MVSPDIQGLGLNDELLEHYRKEVGEMALGILDGKPFDSPVHEGILLTCMLGLLPYGDSDDKAANIALGYATLTRDYARYPPYAGALILAYAGASY